MKIDLDGLEAFVVIAELGGFNKAAAQLHITQTALTRRIQKLESSLGLKLLNRTTRRVELSTVGREFMPQARALVHDLNAAAGRLRDMSRSGSGNFTLACPPSMTTSVLPRVIRRYVELHPANRIRLLDGSSHEVRDGVLSGRAEVGIAVGADKHPELLETLLFEDALCFICREPHRLIGRPKVTWADMRDENLITVSGFTATRVVMDYQLAKHGIRLLGNFEVQHHATAINLVAAGVGSTILPASAFHDGDRPLLRKLALVQPTVKRRIVLLRRKDASLSPAAQAFADLIRKMHVTAP